jgi:hypothetical protein
MQEPRLPKFDYYLDETDPDVVVLRRQDGSFVAAFSARGVTKEGIVEAAEEDYRALLEERARSYDRASEQERGRLAAPANFGEHRPSRRLSEQPLVRCASAPSMPSWLHLKVERPEDGGGP